MVIRGTETGMLKGIAAILTEIPKAYDADYSNLKPSYRRSKKNQSSGRRILDFDPSSDGAFVDNLHECYD